MTNFSTYDGYSVDVNFNSKFDPSSTYYITINTFIKCISKGTLITLSDGNRKPVEELSMDDELLVWDFYERKFSKARIEFLKLKQTASEFNRCGFSDGTVLDLIGSDGYHRIWNRQASEFTHTGKPETPDGTATFTDSGNETVLVRQEIIHEDVDYYNLITERHCCYFANGILVSNRWSNRYGIHDMKYDLADVRITEDEIIGEKRKLESSPVWKHRKSSI